MGIKLQSAQHGSHALSATALSALTHSQLSLACRGTELCCAQHGSRALAATALTAAFRFVLDAQGDAGV
eukprot:229627-Pelagomonas_calceolata.AAC.5